MSQLFLTLAGFRVLMDAKYDYIAKQCKDYIADFSAHEADFTVSATEDEIARELQQGREQGMTASEGYAESICLYRNLCKQLPMRQALLMHAAVISDGTDAYAFTAPSGTGKSTHIRLWRQAFGDGIFVINGDKPILRLINGTWWAYGTPWCGKEGWQTNTCKPLAAVCFLTRGKENRIGRVDPTEAVPALMHQVILPNQPEAAQASLKLMDHLLTHVPLYRLACNVSTEAAVIAREAMTPDR